MVETHDEIRKYLLFALEHYKIDVYLLSQYPKVPRFGDKGPYTPKCPVCSGPYLVWNEALEGFDCIDCQSFIPDENTAERIVRYSNYWNEFKMSIEPQQRKAVEYRYIRKEHWHFVAMVCRVSEDSAKVYASEGISRVVSRIERILKQGSHSESPSEAKKRE